ncbi:MAG: hypothetical protein JWM59_257 [Verrucomicrobiales bacterium]|nr:hypothetical protein [Verrucomicrobiales bacterium]
MWIHTTIGFVSTVADNQQPGNILLRFRTMQHATALAGLIRDPVDIRTTPPPADYRFKFSIPRPVFEALLLELAREVTYTNFKGACSNSTEMAPYSGALHRTWEVWEAIQPKPTTSTRH